MGKALEGMWVKNGRVSIEYGRGGNATQRGYCGLKERLGNELWGRRYFAGTERVGSYGSR